MKKPEGDQAERQLWCAVLGRAVEDATDRVAAVSEPASRKRIRDEARNWFRNNGREFRYVCESAGYDADYLRRRVLAMMEPV
jgi:hypothetical protein